MALKESLKDVSSCNNTASTFDLEACIRSLKQSCEGAMRIEVRREFVLEDSLQESKKSKFSSLKEIKVCIF